MKKFADNDNKPLEISLNADDELSIPEYQVYGDAPPSYKHSKNFPKADLSSASGHIYTNPTSGHNSKNQSRTKKSSFVSQVKDAHSGEAESHIYENIEEVGSSIKASGSRKGKFQPHKKNQSGSSQESIDLMQHRTTATPMPKKFSSPITHMAD